ncbi:MAG: peptide chain release factor N(5)-glutamine methyltransferase [Proteobacteria bacterium]|nr:peptide chain release factor N(5)-glutamine methyltransferase [Pseudomonadota bacterium]
MRLNQAFDILARASDAHRARIVLDWILSKNEKRKTKDEKKNSFKLCYHPFFVFRFSFFVRRCAAQLRRGMPVAKIIGRKWFYGIEFETGRATLDPRPDSETLIDAVLNDYKRGESRLPPAGGDCRRLRRRGGASSKKLSNNFDEKISLEEAPLRQSPAAIDTSPLRGGDATPRILDLGTGTGCLICALVANIPGSTGVGMDISHGAVRVARRNVKRLGLSDRIKISKGNFDSIGQGKRQKAKGKNALCPMPYAFDIIVSNPPYIAVGDPRVDAGARFDPDVALYAGADGLDAYRAIAMNARKLLARGGRIFLEIGDGMGRAVWEIFESNKWRYMGSHDDLSGTERVLVFK